MYKTLLRFVLLTFHRSSNDRHCEYGEQNYIGIQGIVVVYMSSVTRAKITDPVCMLSLFFLFLGTSFIIQMASSSMHETFKIMHRTLREQVIQVVKE